MSDQPIPPLPSHVEQTVSAIARLHAEHHSRSTRMERLIDRTTSFLGSPAFLAILSVAVLAWIGGNLMVFGPGHAALDPPPFPWLQDSLTLMALFMGVFILTTQRRAAQFADLRAQMTLELVILTEQKTAKLIHLIEELRRDSPEVRDRIDPEARAMAAQTDPHVVLGAIEKTHQEMMGAADAKVKKADERSAG